MNNDLSKTRKKFEEMGGGGLQSINQLKQNSWSNRKSCILRRITFLEAE